MLRVRIDNGKTNKSTKVKNNMIIEPWPSTYKQGEDVKPIRLVPNKDGTELVSKKKGIKNNRRSARFFVRGLEV